ncbi:MAG: peptidylprolyl isomerase [Thermodesulfobacteriota bacterium]
MMRKRIIFFGLSVLFFSCLLSCQKPGEKELGSGELVRINSVSISLEEFRQVSERQPLEGKMRLLNEKGLRDFLDNYVITREVLYQEAKQKGLDQNKEIMTKMEDFKRAIVIDALLEEALKGKSEVSESEVQNYYKDNQSRFIEPQEVKIRHIVVNSEPILKEVLVKLSRGEKFERLAFTYNIDKSKEDGGDLGYIRRGQLAPSFAQFEEAAFSLKERGDVSEVVKTPFGYHLVQLVDKRGTALKPFAQVKEKIQFFLQAKKRQDAYLEYVREAKGRAKILINERLWAEEEKKEPKPKEEKR